MNVEHYKYICDKYIKVEENWRITTLFDLVINDIDIRNLRVKESYGTYKRAYIVEVWANDNRKHKRTVFEGFDTYMEAWNVIVDMLATEVLFI